MPVKGQEFQVIEKNNIVRAFISYETNTVE